MDVDYRRGLDWWIGFIDHLYTPLGTATNYSVTANLHNPHQPFLQPAVASTPVP
jgi:hypothetical protein